MTFNNIYKGKKVLITGNTGFKGSWLSVWLETLGAEVYGYSLNVPTNPSMFEILDLEKKVHHQWGDIRDRLELNSYIQRIKPDFIFHLAAQALVSQSYIDPYETVTTNVAGTAAVLEAMRNITWDCTCVLITSDKAYDNREWLRGYRENDRLGGKDVYSGSKGAAELIIKSYWYSFLNKMPHLKMGIARAGNVIGGGDWAKDRIVVDCIKAFANGEIVEIRCPKATRPWQHVLEPLSGYLTLGQYLREGLVENGEAFNFGPRAGQTKTVLELTHDLAKQWGLDTGKYINITDEIPFNESALLKLNCDKALSHLHWQATLSYEQCIRMIAEWYRAYYENRTEDMYQLTVGQIRAYMVVD
ncbi:MAG: CDP-glucose 4,6-dehydratase [Tannerella sp.]|jgi:CDP-glucose 4,6-dehydratase|nr:CDP-glucose 4,6-dehydratase [Tannerella sp.]